VVAIAENEGIAMDKLTLEQLQAVDNRFGSDVLNVFNYEHSVEMKSATGGTSRFRS
jgi:argininosuccinate lyase